MVNESVTSIIPIWHSCITTREIHISTQQTMGHKESFMLRSRWTIVYKADKLNFTVKASWCCWYRHILLVYVKNNTRSETIFLPPYVYT